MLYNRQLRNDMKQRQQLFNLKKLRVDTYHSFGHSEYNAPDCKTDQGLKRVMIEDLQPKSPLDFDLLCLDELQDATPIIYGFTRKIIRDNNPARNMQYLVLGDPRQVNRFYRLLTKRKFTPSITLINASLPWPN
jgi:hypothetical protein